MRTWEVSPGDSSFLILWKSYLFSCRTKEAKLECLNILGRMVLVNSVMSLTMNESPAGDHDTRCASLLSSSVLHEAGTHGGGEKKTSDSGERAVAMEDCA